MRSVRSYIPTVVESRKNNDPPPLSHMDDHGRPKMVDVGGKSITTRKAVATGSLVISPATFELLDGTRNPKGDPFTVARLAGIMAAKRTAELIPLCHGIALTHVDVSIEADTTSSRLKVMAEASASAQTGVDMEALTAVSVALLTLYDMLKSADKGMVLSEIALLSKEGGRSGNYVRT